MRVPEPDPHPTRYSDHPANHGHNSCHSTNTAAPPALVNLSFSVPWTCRPPRPTAHRAASRQPGCYRCSQLRRLAVQASRALLRAWVEAVVAAEDAAAGRAVRLGTPTCRSERLIVVSSEAEKSEPPVGIRGVTQLPRPLVKPRRPRTAWSWDEDLRFLGFARNHYGLGKAAQGDENNGSSVVKPGGGFEEPVSKVSSEDSSRRWRDDLRHHPCHQHVIRRKTPSFP